jgi:SLT domain-containing protein
MKLNLLADVSGFSTGINTADVEAKGLSGKMEKYGKRMAKAFALAAAAAGAMAVKIGLEGVQAASDLNEEVSKAEVIFGDTAKEIKDFAKTADRALGLTNKSALQAASTFAILGKNAGLTGTELSKFSKDSTKIAADLGSFFNTSTEDAVLAIGSALRGEAEPIRRYGVLISAASLEQAAFNFETRTGTELARDAKNQLTEQSKVLARYQAILDQTTDAQGDFSRTSDGLANSQKILAAQLENLKATMGTSLLPVAKEVITQLNFMAAAFGGKDPEGLSERARELAGAYDGQGGGAYNLVLAIKNVGDSFSRMFDSMSGPNATEAGTALQNIANAINGIANAFDKLGTAYGKVKPVLDKFPASIIRNRFWDFVFSSAQSDVSRAAGGPVMANQVARVGEFGPELFVPNGVSGSIRKDNGAGSGNTFIFNGVIDGESARRSIEKLLQDSARRTGAVNFVGATL